MKVAMDFSQTSNKQVLFFKAHSKYIAYGGARGGGKSWAARMKAVLLCFRYNNLRVLLLRRTFPELEANHIMPLQIILKDAAHYVVSKKKFIFPNGSFIQLGYCKNEYDSIQYQGHEYDVIIFEEATLFLESQLIFISTCLRTTRPDFVPRIYYTCNPGGPSHHYIKRLFIDKAYEGTENPDEYTFIPASIYDNRALLDNDPTYITVLDNLPDELRKAHRDGDWDALSGQYFREFRRSSHVIEPFDIPKGWTRYVTLDYGLDMTAAYWIAVDYEGYCYCYKELYEKDLIVSDAAAKLSEISKGENIKYYYMPPDIRTRKQDTGKSGLQLFAENGIIGIITTNDRESGWLCLKELLKPWGSQLVPRLRFFNTCRNIIKCLPMVQRDMKNPNDISKEPHDLTHGPDSLRYFASTWIKKPEHDVDLTLSGTYYIGELLMKGYSKTVIKRMALSGKISIIG
jgi:phage terminase large subunit